MLQRLRKKRRSNVQHVSEDAMLALRSYGWPGNVRELENVIQRCVVVAQGDTILRKDLPQEILDAVAGGVAGAVQAPVAAHADTVTDGDATPPLKSVAGEESPAGNAFDGADTVGAAAVADATPVPAPDPVFDLPPPPPQSVEKLYDLLYKRLREEHDRNLLEKVEKEITRRVLRETGGNQVKASALLGITRATLRKRMDTFDLRNVD
jgi:DNA-binding NtrC family response regulator